MDQSSDTEIIEQPPVFMKGKDVPDYMSLKDFEVFTAVTAVIGMGNCVGVQRVRGLWRIYGNTIEDRVNLISSKIVLRDVTVDIFDLNPFITLQTSPDDNILKIIFKDIPLSKGNSLIETFLKDRNIVLLKPIRYGKIRHPNTNKLTDCKNGDRIIFCKPLSQPLPHNVLLGSNTKARVFHQGQVLNIKDKRCTKCFTSGHYNSQCTNTNMCKLCQATDHMSGDKKCPAFISQPQTSVFPFQGFRDTLSNFYPCQMKIYGMNHKSSDHAYSYKMAIQHGREDIAEIIMEAPTALAAKKAVRPINCSDGWDTMKFEVMTEIVEAKAKYVPEFKNDLLETKDCIIAESVMGDFVWSCGLNKEETLHTKKRYWPGKNEMGKILMKLRKRLEDELKGRKHNGATYRTRSTVQSEHRDQHSSDESVYSYE